MLRAAFVLLLIVSGSCCAMAGSEAQSNIAKQAVVEAADESGYEDCSVWSTDAAFHESWCQAEKSACIAQMEAASIPAQDQLAFLHDVDLVIGGGDFFQARGNDYLEDGEGELALASSILYAEIFSWTYYHGRSEWDEAIAEANGALACVTRAVTAFSNAVSDFETAIDYYTTARLMLDDWENQL